MADVAEEYRSSLSELNFNSKPHINMLTMLAEENVAHAHVIVQSIVDHINSVTPDVKLPSLYLVDSIVKNIGKVYIPHFSKHLVSLFTSVFEKVDENVRSLLYKLRSTWTGIFPNTVLFHLDKSVATLDPAWPILAQPSHIHVNPKFLDKPSAQLPKKPEPVLTPQTTLLQEVEMKKKQLALLQSLHQKKQELIQLQLKAALTASTAAESAKVETKKVINTRDPRLSKKVLASSAGSEPTALQSVVVVPKGITSKRNDKDSPSSVSKKIKLDDSEQNFKNDFKNKSSSVSAESNSNEKVNASQNDQNGTGKISQNNVLKSSQNKKRPFRSEGSDEFHSVLDNVNKTSQTAMQYKSESKDSHHHKTNFMSDKTNELVTNFDSHKNFIPKVPVTEEQKYLFKSHHPEVNEELHCSKIQKLEPPPPPPLFLGREDKDYRVLPKTTEKRTLDESYHKRVTVPVVKSFILDQKERKVYFVNDRSFTFMDDNVPKELSFEGPSRLVFIEGLPQPIELGFGQEVKFEIDGKINFMKFGTPSREVYINDIPYEAQFGGPPLPAVLSDDKVHSIHISGPPPVVVVSESPAYDLYEKFCQINQEFLRRFDSEPNLCNISSNINVGTRDIDMRVNSVKLSSAFFDFPLERMHDVDWQKIHVNNSQQTEWNAPKNSFESSKDGQPNFVPGHRNYSENPEWETAQTLPSEIQTTTLEPPPLPPKQIINRFPCMAPPIAFTTVSTPLLPFPSNGNARPVSTISVPFSIPSQSHEFVAKHQQLNIVTTSVIPRLSPPPLPPFLGANPISSSITSTISLPTSALYTNTSLSTPLSLHTSTPLLSMPPFQSLPRLAAPVPEANSAASVVVSSTIPGSVPNFTATSTSTAITSTVYTNDMQLFLEKLKAAGLIKSDPTTPKSESSNEPSTEIENEEESKDESLKIETIPEIRFESKCLKEYHSGVIGSIYNGSQCATCGARFKEIQSEQYSQHLDWHFRRNRREKDGAKKPFSRRWFYEIKDWIEFKEFEDVDERAPSYFELQANIEQTEEEPETICSVSCSECDSEKCAVCGEQFQLFWIEEEEEWHLRNAVKNDDQVYHPACYEDFKKAREPKAANPETIDEPAVIKPEEENSNIDIKIKTEPMDLDFKEEKEDVEMTEVGEKSSSEIKKEVEEKKPVVKQEVVKLQPTIKQGIEKIPPTAKKNIEIQPTAKKNIEIQPTAKKNIEIQPTAKKNIEIQPTAKKNVEGIQPSEKKKIEGIQPSEKKNIEGIHHTVEKGIKAVQPVSEKNAEEIQPAVKKNIKEMQPIVKKGIKEIHPTVKKNIEEIQSTVKKEIKEVQATVKKEIQATVKKEVEETNSITKKEMEETKSMKEKEIDGIKSVTKTEVDKAKSGIEKGDDKIKCDLKEIVEESEVKEKTSVKDVDPINKDKTESEGKQLSDRSVEPSEEPKDNKEAKINENKSSDTSTESSETSTKIKSVSSVQTDKKSELSSQSENVPVKNDDEIDDIEFRPPTPDPRFQVLPPVNRGTEISNLCIIM